jgi:hypothetical protein
MVMKRGLNDLTQKSPAFSQTGAQILFERKLGFFAGMILSIPKK